MKGVLDRRGLVGRMGTMHSFFSPQFFRAGAKIDNITLEKGIQPRKRTFKI